MENKQKVGLSTKDWVLCIGGIIIFVLLMILPPVFRIVFEEEVPVPQKENNEIEEVLTNREEDINDSTLTKIICMKQTTYPEYINNSIIILSHENGLLKILTEDTTNTYLLNSKDSESLYTEEKLACTNTPETFYQITGFNYSCKVAEDTVQTIKKYDLNRFASTNEFHSPFILNQNTTDIIASLSSEGYTCE